MTETSRFWSSTSPGDAGPYSADQFAQYTRYLFGDSANADSGPITGSGVAPDPGLTVQQRGAGANMSVDVTAGAAFVNGTFYYTDSTVNLAIGNNVSGNPRIDTVILRKDWSAQTVRLFVKQGTPAGSPVPPGLTQSSGTTWEIPLYDVAVANAAASITNANITPHKIPANVADGIYLQGMLNNTGGVLVNGDVVMIDTSADRAVKLPVGYLDQGTIGVWQDRTAAGAYGRVLVYGIGYVNMSGATTRGQDIGATGSSAKTAGVFTAGTQLNAFATALQTIGGPGLCLCFISPTIALRYVQNSRNFSVIRRNNGADYTTVSNVFVDVDGTNLVASFTVTCGKIQVNCSGIISGNTTDIKYIDITVNGVSVGGTNGVWHATVGAADVPFSFSTLITGLGGGANPVKIRWKTTAGTATMRSTAADVVNLSAYEVG